MMNLTCAILHADRQVSEQLEAFIAKTPFLALCGKYSNPIEALKGYYDNKVHLILCRNRAGRNGGHQRDGIQ